MIIPRLKKKNRRLSDLDPNSLTAALHWSELAQELDQAPSDQAPSDQAPSDQAPSDQAPSDQAPARRRRGKPC
jgi:hypothetical protein